MASVKVVNESVGVYIEGLSAEKGKLVYVLDEPVSRLNQEADFILRKHVEHLLIKHVMQNDFAARAFLQNFAIRECIPQCLIIIALALNICV